MNFEIDGFDAMRQALRAMCTHLFNEQVPDETAFDARLVAGELLSNALRHGGGHARLTVEVQGDAVRVCVKSERNYCPPLRCPPADVYAEGGRGMFLVDALAAFRDYSEEEGVIVKISVK